MPRHVPATPQPVSGSLRRQLLLVLLSGLGLIWLVTASLTVVESRHELDELLDAHLAQSAALLLAQVGEDVDDIEVEHAPDLHRYAHQAAFQIWDADGNLQLHSSNAPATPLSARREGFSDNRINTHAWRVFSATTPDRRYQVHVGESLAAREKLAGEMLGQLLSPLLIALPLFGLLVWLAVTRSLRSVNQLSDSLAQQQPGQLHAVTTPVPRELAPLVIRLNELLARVDASLANERRFTSDAAHELRTPLAAIHTQLQVAQGARDGKERDRAIAMALSAGDRATRLTDQLLTLARVDHGQPALLMHPVALRDIARHSIEMLAQEASRKHIALALESVAGDPACINGHADLLQILLRNLIDNAIRYSPPDTSVTVSLQRCGNAVAGEQILLTVSDEGPGIPEAQRAAAMQRFHRLDETGRHGSGLGLSIVQRIAELHDTVVVLDQGPAGRGLQVQLRFPAGPDTATAPEQ